MYLQDNTSEAIHSQAVITFLDVLNWFSFKKIKKKKQSLANIFVC